MGGTVNGSNKLRSVSAKRPHHSGTCINKGNICSYDSCSVNRRTPETQGAIRGDSFRSSSPMRTVKFWPPLRTLRCMTARSSRPQQGPGGFMITPTPVPSRRSPLPSPIPGRIGV